MKYPVKDVLPRNLATDADEVRYVGDEEKNENRMSAEISRQ